MTTPLNPIVSAARSSLQSRYQDLLAREPRLRIRNAAQRLGVSELALLETRLGHGVTRLHPEPRAILRCVPGLGEVMALTRNDAVVHERHGQYANIDFFRHGKVETGLVLNDEIDLRLFMQHWAHCLAVADNTPTGPRHSLQFFDASGQAIHKIYMTAASDSDAYQRLVSLFVAPDQRPTEAFDAPAPRTVDPDDAELDRDGLEQGWRALQDTHDFHPLLKRFRAGRQQALRLVSDDLARPVSNDALRRVLETARDSGCAIMVFVGNAGCMQIHSGPVVRLAARDNWYNVLDPRFNLHVDTDRIATSWVTRKPTVDGTVTAVEVFDADGAIIVSLFGQRKPGEPERGAWRAIVAALEARQ